MKGEPPLGSIYLTSCPTSLLPLKPDLSRLLPIQFLLAYLPFILLLLHWNCLSRSLPAPMLPQIPYFNLKQSAHISKLGCDGYWHLIILKVSIFVLAHKIMMIFAIDDIWDSVKPGSVDSLSFYLIFQLHWPQLTSNFLNFFWLP